MLILLFLLRALLRSSLIGLSCILKFETKIFEIFDYFEFPHLILLHKFDVFLILEEFFLAESLWINFAIKNPFKHKLIDFRKLLKNLFILFFDLLLKLFDLLQSFLLLINFLFRRFNEFSIKKIIQMILLFLLFFFFSFYLLLNFLLGLLSNYFFLLWWFLRY